MTRDAYAREVWKVIEAVKHGEEQVVCPHENCNETLQVMVASVRTGKTFICPEHGVIFRE